MGEFKIGMFGYFEFTVTTKKPKHKNWKETPTPITGYFKVIDQDSQKRVMNWSILKINSIN